MQYDPATFEVTDYGRNAPLDRGMVRAVAADEFRDNCP
jgi:hypothetical protein